MVEKRDLYLVGLAAILAIGVHFYDVGKRKVALVATQDSLKVVEHEKGIIAKQRDSIGSVLRAKGEQTEKTRIAYRDTRPEIKGDSAFDKSGQFIQVLDPRISSALASAGEHIANLESELITAKALVKIDTVFIAKVEKESDLNKSIAKQIKGSRFSHGLQLGVGYCRSSIGGTPCLYVGYGFSARF